MDQEIGHLRPITEEERLQWKYQKVEKPRNIINKFEDDKGLLGQSSMYMVYGIKAAKTAEGCCDFSGSAVYILPVIRVGNDTNNIQFTVQHGNKAVRLPVVSTTEHERMHLYGTQPIAEFLESRGLEPTVVYEGSAVVAQRQLQAFKAALENANWPKSKTDCVLQFENTLRATLGEPAPTAVRRDAGLWHLGRVYRGGLK